MAISRPLYHILYRMPSVQYTTFIYPSYMFRLLQLRHYQAVQQNREKKFIYMETFVDKMSTLQKLLRIWICMLYNRGRVKGNVKELCFYEVS